MRTVFVSGCWDLIHPGHIEILKFARAQGDYLIVSVASDANIRLLKKREPLFNADERLIMVSELRCVDQAFITYNSAGNADCFQYITEFSPNVWVFNQDDPNAVQKGALAAACSIEVVYNIRPPQWHSTTGLIARVKAEYA